MQKTRLAVIALLGVGFVWGAAFVLMKDAIEQQPYMDFLATRFSIAALAMVILRPRVALAMKPGDLKFGALIGVVLAFGYITQTIGLELTTAATSGFLTGSSCWKMVLFLFTIRSSVPVQRRNFSNDW